MKEDIVKKAIELLQPIKYEPFATGYFVVKNGDDMGGSDFCENCIKDAVKKEIKFHKEKRESIIEQYKSISEKGYYKEGRKKIVVSGYTQREINQSRRFKLKDYPAKATFTYDGHDPDFGGGLHEPCCCENCGEAFSCSFTPDKEEAESLLSIVKNNNLDDKDKWEIDIALSNYQYTKDDVKQILKKVAKKTILIIDK